MAVDFDFIENASFTVVQPRSAWAKCHLLEMALEDWQRVGAGFAMETRYAPELAADLCRNGFCIALPDGRAMTAADLK